MARLTLEERQRRLHLDRRAVMGLECPWLRVVPCASADEAHRGPKARATMAASPPAYFVQYDLETLVAGGRRHRGVGVVFDLLPGGNYPFSAPVATVITRPTPWSPHFRAQGPICLGPVWELANGEVLLAHLVVHVAKLLNFDEPIALAHGGYHPDAFAWWRDRLGGRPLNPSLAYPTLPHAVTHGLFTGGAP